MLFLINPFIFAAAGGGGSEVAEIVHLNLSADDTGVNATAGVGGYTISWDNEVSDAQNRHEGVTNPERITFLAGDAGKIAILNAGLRLGSMTVDEFVDIRINIFNSSDTLVHRGVFKYENPGGTGFLNVCIIYPSITSGDYSTVQFFTETDTSVDVETDQSTYFAAIILDT